MMRVLEGYRRIVRVNAPDRRAPRQSGREGGTALIMFIGIMAALSILSVALVTLLANAQHSTSREKSRTTAFDVAEAAIDVSMNLLTDEWPGALEKNWEDTDFLARAPQFAGQFGVTSGLAADDTIQVLLLDDTDVDLTAAERWDANGNGYVWLDAQARVNGVSSRVRAMVQADFYEFGLAKGIVLYAGGDLNSTSADENKPVVGAQDVTVGGTQPVSIAIWGDISDPSVAYPYVDQDPLYKPTREELLSDETIEDLKLLAQRTGKYFTSVPPAQDFTGLCVIEVPSGTTVAMPQDSDPTKAGNQPFNSIEHPGVLLVLGGGELKISGGMVYYGVIYSSGTLSFSSGNPIIYGMVVAENDVTVAGSPQVIYREDCMMRLDTQFQTNTKLVPNYWRELAPLTPSPTAAP